MMEKIPEKCKKCDHDILFKQAGFYHQGEVCIVVTCAKCGHERLAIVDRYVFEHPEKRYEP